MRVAFILSGVLASSIACSSFAPGDPCDPVDPVLADSSFVVVIEPTLGLRASSPLLVRGCSRTSESNVVWELRYIIFFPLSLFGCHIFFIAFSGGKKIEV